MKAVLTRGYILGVLLLAVLVATTPCPAMAMAGDADPHECCDGESHHSEEPTSACEVRCALASEAPVVPAGLTLDLSHLAVSTSLPASTELRVSTPGSEISSRAIESTDPPPLYVLNASFLI